jgi:hypothetical protein
MAQYKFNKDWWGGTYVPPEAGMATSRVDYKKGDVVDGTFVHVKGSEVDAATNYVVVTSPQGTVRVPMGRGSVLDLVSGQGSRPAAKGVAETGLFTKKNIIIAVVVIAIIVAVIYFIKRKKIA